jgi:hypothetical protein
MSTGQLDSRGCSNPCSQTQPLNTAACETLSSQIENFTLDFFGEVFKTEVNGQVQWSLPGRLDVGLPLNPRGATEPLGCYLLRLFETGVVGAQGAQGRPGLPGCNGSTPYVQVVKNGFFQPAIGVTFAATVSLNPSILPGMDVFIDGSGWYEIVTSDGKGNITLVLRKAVVNPQPYVAVGTVLLPSGKIGDVGATGVPGIKGATGNKGQTGDPGATGPTGDPGSPSNASLPLVAATIAQYTTNSPGIQHNDGYMGGITPAGFINVTLYPGPVALAVTLPTPGTYLLLARCGNGTTPISAGPGLTVPLGHTGSNQFQFKNVSTNTVVPQSLATSTSAITMVMMVAFVSTLTANNLIQVQAKGVVGDGVVSCHYFWAIKVS